MKYKFAPILLISSTSIIANAQDQPNIIIFLVDDMGLMDTQVPFLTNKNGDPVRYPLNDWYRTPNMEQMANQGIRFSNFYAQSVSSPTRSSIITGQNATRHKTTNWINSETNNKTTFGPSGWNWDGINSNTTTLPRILQQNGYHTIHVGKAHFGRQGSEGEDPKNIGFDINIAGSSIGQPGSYYGEHGYGNIKGQKSRAVQGLDKYHGTDTFLTDALTIEATEAISKSTEQNKPFFLYMAHYAVHAPFETDKRFLNNYNDDSKSEQAKSFATLIEGMDKSLGDIIDHLKTLGIADNTLIFFLGDNGSDAPLGDEKGHFSSAPLRGKKGTEYEGGVRTPLIVSWAKPNNKNKVQKRMPIKQNAIQEQIATVMDIYPTILDVTGISNSKNHTLDGYSLQKQLESKKNKRRKNHFLMHFPHEHRGSYFTTLRQDDWKIIYWYNPETPDKPTYELYNLKRDPFEENDLSVKRKSILKKMIKKMIYQLEIEDALYPESKDGDIIRPVLPSY